MKRVNRVWLAGVFFSSLACSSLNGSKDQPAEFTLQISTSPCFGRCPVYKLSVNSNGNAIYTGLRHPKTEGDIKRVLPAFEMDSIRYVLDKNNFWELDSLYDNPNVSDLPSFSVVYSSESRTKTVIGRFDTPDDFRKISAYLERMRKRNFGDLEQ